VSGYKHKPIPAGSKMSLEELKKGGYILDERGWLRVSVFIFRCYFRCFITVIQRILFLETIAGVPGMVAAMLRHLSSLRLMVRQIYSLTVPFLIVCSAGTLVGYTLYWRKPRMKGCI
jgi:ubiquinol oxidase